MRLARAEYEDRAGALREALPDLDGIGAIASYHRGDEICGAQSFTDYWGRVVAGIARQCAFHRDGRRQILAFVWPGDFFGFALGPQYRYAVEAVSDGTVVARYRAREIEKLLSGRANPVEALSRIALDSLACMQSRLMSLGRLTARERVCGFLVEMNRRSPGRRPDSISLRMSRCDIADYLALSVETVSRILTELRLEGTIALPTTRQVTIADRGALGSCDGVE